MYCMTIPQPILLKSHTGLLAQSAERRANNANVMSSILIQTKFFFFTSCSLFCCLRRASVKDPKIRGWVQVNKISFERGQVIDPKLVCKYVIPCPIRTLL